MTDTLETSPSGAAAAEAAFAAAKASALSGAPATAVPPTPVPAPAPAPAPAAAAEAAPAPNPAPAPAGPPAIAEEAPADAPAEGLEAEAPASDGAVTYTPTGDAAMDVALGFIGKLGIGPDTPEMVEAAKGNFAFLEAKLASLGDKAVGWQQFVALGKQSFEAATAKAKASDAAITEAVNQAVGGPEVLNSILSWAAQAASPEEKKHFNEQLRSNPLAARLAASELMRLYQNAGGTVVNPKPVTKGDTPNSASVPTAPLTRKEYSQEVDKLSRKLGGNLNNSPEYAALNARFLNQ